MKKKSTLWIALVMLALVAFFLKLAFTKSDEKDKRGDKENCLLYTSDAADE